MYSFRPATLADRDFLYQLHRNTMRPYVAATWGWNEEEQQELFRQHFDPTGRQIIQLIGPDTATATDIGTLEVENQSAAWYLALIEIAPEYQNQGIGTAIITHFIQQAHTQGRPLNLSVLKANTPARRLYERLGFTITTEEDIRHQMTNSPMNNEQ